MNDYSKQDYYENAQRTINKFGKKVVVNGRVFVSAQRAAGFMNLSQGYLAKLLNDGKNEHKGYKIAWYKE